MTKPLDLTGQRFGQLIAAERSGRDRHGKTMWQCRCDCGNTIIVPIGALREGTRKDCGCAYPNATIVRPRRPQTLLYGYVWSPEGGVVIDEAAAQCIRYVYILEREGLPRRLMVLAIEAAHPRPDKQPWRVDHIDRMLNNRHLYQGGRRGKRPERWPVLLEA